MIGLGSDENGKNHKVSPTGTRNRGDGKKLMGREVNSSIRAAADSNVTRVQKSEVLFVQLAELKRGLNIHGRRCTLIAP